MNQNPLLKFKLSYEYGFLRRKNNLRWSLLLRVFLNHLMKIYRGKWGLKMKQLPFMGVVCIVMLFIVYRTSNYQYHQAEMEARLSSFEHLKESHLTSAMLRNLPNGIIESHSDMELKPLWWTHGLKSKVDESVSHNLLAISVGIKQKRNVDAIVRKFLSANFTVILFHYDGHVDGWSDLDWSGKALHVAVQNQTKWWFAKRFLHPDVVSMYDYIFLWDEDLGVEHFNPRRYISIVKVEGLEISQPALDPNSTDIHHRITIRSRSKKFHRRVYDDRGHTKCDDHSEGPPCSGFVEGMAPVFSRSAWYCAWHLIQNDLIHGWGMDMKLGYCAQGERSKKVGVVDSEYIVHKGIQTLGGRKVSNRRVLTKKRVDTRTEIRRQSTWELGRFKERWKRAVEEDDDWVQRNSYTADDTNTYHIKRKKRKRRRD